MNEILKFKKGRMIPKHQDGGGIYSASDLVEAGNRAFGLALYYDKRTGDLVQIASKDALTRDGKVKGEVVRTGAEMQSRPYSVFNITGWKTIGPYQGLKKRTLTGKTHINEKEEIAELNRLNPAGQQKPATGVRTGRPGRATKDWGKEFTNFMGGLSSEQQEWLRKNGLQDPKMLQEYLNNMKFDVGKFGADGKFGKDSKDAWNRFVASGIMGKNNDQEILKRQLEELKKTEPVIDAPDPFGYKTTNTYEGNDFANKLKGMGIRSNADLINFMHNSGKAGWKGDAWQTQFRSDVDKALGGDYSDANIRKVFGTQGKWGRGFMGRGDFGDFQNALQTNAGIWNGMYNRKESEARMDAGRQQLATKMTQQYIEQNPIQLTAPKKFTIGNNVGANTLGLAGQGSMGGNDWMKFAAQSGYLPKQTEEPQEDWMKFAAQTGYLPS